MDLSELINSINIAEDLDEEYLTKLGKEVYQDWQYDEQSRSEWKIYYDKAMRVALQVMDKKSYPWPNASNVKIPLLTSAAINFHAKAYPSLVQPKLVQFQVIGDDPDGAKERRAERLTKHMSYQIFNEMENWEEEMDALLLALPITGLEFKKTYYDPFTEQNISEHVPAKDLCVNYWAKDLESAPCITHLLEMQEHEIISYQNNSLYRQCSLKVETTNQSDPFLKAAHNKATGISPPSSGVAPFTVLEQYRRLDLDDDGYPEPYIVTVLAKNQKVLRIQANFDKKSILKKNGHVVKITPEACFTKYQFLPSPDGSFYSIGFGHLIAPMNYSVNTLVNQVIDAGSLSNLPAGFAAKGLRLKGGQLNLQPGEWRVVNAMGIDIRQGLLPLPYKEPSGTLVQLMMFLVNMAERLAATTDMQIGENPGQNQKAETSRIVQENGMRVFTAVYKRIRAAMTKELKKLFLLNSKYLKNTKYSAILDPSEANGMTDMQNLSKADYNPDDFNVVPAADPSIATLEQRVFRAQSLYQLALQDPLVSHYASLKRLLEALEVPAIDEVLPPEDQIPQPPPDPQTVKNQIEAARVQLEKEKQDWEMDFKERELEVKAQAAGVEAGVKLRDAENRELATQGKVASDAAQNTLRAQEMVNDQIRDAGRTESDRL